MTWVSQRSVGYRNRNKIMEPQKDERMVCEEQTKGERKEITENGVTDTKRATQVGRAG